MCQIDNVNATLWILFMFLLVIHSIVSDLCGLLKPGEGLRSKVDEMMTNSTEEELGGLGEVFANYSSNDQKNACSVDFFNAQSKSLDDCYPLPNFDLSALKDIVCTNLTATLGSFSDLSCPPCFLNASAVFLFPI